MVGESAGKIKAGIGLELFVKQPSPFDVLLEE